MQIIFKKQSSTLSKGLLKLYEDEIGYRLIHVNSTSFKLFIGSPKGFGLVIDLELNEEIFEEDFPAFR